ncbi:type II secretion system protein N [Pseudomonas fluorescens]|uniref:type II secretion system protein N n=1 Tax=Pseudomonas fluorescens TaxID=294 RepID=UPI00352481FF
MFRRLFSIGLLMLCMGYAAFLAWQERGYREGLAAPLPAAAPASVPAVPAPLDTTAVATVLGLAAATPMQPSAEALSLQASFVSADGLSKALLAGAEGARIYTVGDELPGGSVLRRVEANRVVLWNKGREEVLTLQTSAVRFLHRAEDQPEAPAPSTRYLRPRVGQPE